MAYDGGWTAARHHAPPADSWHPMAFPSGDEGRPAPGPSAFRRRFSALVAGVAALTVALAGGALAVDRAHHPLAAGWLPGTSQHAADTSSRTPRPRAPKHTVPPEPVFSVGQVAARVDPGVVVITSELGYQNALAAGTGMVLTPAGEILTNNHVIAGATSITVTVVSTGRQYAASVVGTAVANDVAVLQMQGASGLSTIPLGSSDGVHSGQSVVAIGNAGGHGQLSVVSGAVTATDRTIMASDQQGQSSERLTGMIEVQAPIQAGDSGGPLASRAGKVIGMDTAASATLPRRLAGPTLGFAIPINQALAIVAQIHGGGPPAGTGVGQRGYLGIQVSAGDPGVNPGGALVIATTAGSPAEAAGLAPGDIVTTLDGEPVTSATSLTKSLAQSKPGQRVALGWVDSAGVDHQAQITLAPGPAD